MPIKPTMCALVFIDREASIRIQPLVHYSDQSVPGNFPSRRKDADEQLAAKGDGAGQYSRNAIEDQIRLSLWLKVSAGTPKANVSVGTPRIG